VEPITLEPGYMYLVGVTAGASEPCNALLFAATSAYDVTGGMQLYIDNVSFNQWYLDPAYDAWTPGGPHSGEGVKMELNLTAVPEPAGVAICLAGCVASACWSRRRDPTAAACRA
jgi:hypothetical protein